MKIIAKVGVLLTLCLNLSAQFTYTTVATGGGANDFARSGYFTYSYAYPEGTDLILRNPVTDASIKVEVLSPLRSIGGAMLLSPEAARTLGVFEPTLIHVEKYITDSIAMIEEDLSTAPVEDRAPSFQESRDTQQQAPREAELFPRAQLQPEVDTTREIEEAPRSILDAPELLPTPPNRNNTASVELPVEEAEVSRLENAVAPTVIPELVEETPAQVSIPKIPTVMEAGSSKIERGDYIQVGAFTVPSHASEVYMQLSKQYNTSIIEQNRVQTVLVGPVLEDEKGVLLHSLRSAGYLDAFPVSGSKFR